MLLTFWVDNQNMRRKGPILRRKGRSALALMVVASLTVPAHAQTTASATGRTTIINPLSVSAPRDRDFGRLSAGTSAGTATINPITETRTISGGAQGAGGTPISASFAARGVAGRMLHIGVPTTPIIASNGTGATMTISNFAHNGGNGPILLDAAGDATIHVGATISLSAGQAEGAYSAHFSIIAIYL